MTKYQGLADVLAAIAFCADEAARSVANLDHPENFPDSLGEMKARAGRDTSVLLDLLDMPVEYAAMMAELDGQNEQAATPLLATEKTDHPALQPVLRRADVNTLIGYVGTERNNAETEAIRLSKQSDPAGVPAAPNAAGYTEGLDRAHEIVSSMWEAAVLTADMQNNPPDDEE